MTGIKNDQLLFTSFDALTKQGRQLHLLKTGPGNRMQSYTEVVDGIKNWLTKPRIQFKFSITHITIYSSKLIHFIDEVKGEVLSENYFTCHIQLLHLP